MPAYAYVLIVIIVVGALVFVGWRLASRRYALPCPSWLSWMLEHPFQESGRAQAALEHLKLESGMQVLDVGCGPGRLTVPLARAVGPQGRVTALDIQPSMLRRARLRAEAARVDNIRFVQGGAGAGLLGHNEFDRALLVTVLGEIPQREAALQEIYEALKPGGFLAVTEIALDPHFQSRGTILRLAHSIGFHESAFFGNRFSFTLNLAKPEST